MSFRVSRLSMAFMLAWTLAVAGCGGGTHTATQAVAKVNDSEITVHQVNQLLEMEGPQSADGTQAASRRALESLIDQELAIQQAQQRKLDREPRVVAAIEAAKRDIIARAFVAKVGEAASATTSSEIEAFYREHPGLFSNRKIYSLLEFNVQVPADRLADVESHIRAARAPQEFQDWLKAQSLPYSSNQGQQPAEALPMSVVEPLAALPEGHALALPLPQGSKALFVTAARSAPLSLEQARPAIERSLANQRKGALVAAEMKRLHTAAKIEYLGAFAASAPAGTAPDQARGATPAVTASAASGGIDPDTLKKGLGLK